MNEMKALENLFLANVKEAFGLSAGRRSNAQGLGLSKPKKAGARNKILDGRVNIFLRKKEENFFRSSVDFQSWNGKNAGFSYRKDNKTPLGVRGIISGAERSISFSAELI